MLDAADGIEDHLRALYESGADSPDAIDLLDQVVAIIRRKDLTDSRRVRELAVLFGAGHRLR